MIARDTDPNDPLDCNSWCKSCHWIGTSGQLIAGGRTAGLRCPECDSENIYIGKGLTRRERLDNLKAAFVENDIPWPVPWPTQH